MVESQRRRADKIGTACFKTGGGMRQSAYMLAGLRQMQSGDLTGGTFTYGGTEYPCAVGTFEMRQVLTTGGFTQMLLGDIQAASSDLPDGASFKAGHLITVTPTAGPSRNCKVQSVKHLGAIISITLHDQNQGA